MDKLGVHIQFSRDNINKAAKLISLYDIKVASLFLKSPRSAAYTLFSDDFIKKWKDLISTKEFYFNSNFISRVCYGKQKTAYGYKWKFKTQTN